MQPKSLKSTLFFRLSVPLLFFILLETVVTFAVAAFHVGRAYDRWLLDSALSLMREIRVENDKISIQLAQSALEIFTWDDVDTTYFKIATENQKLLVGEASLPPAPVSSDWNNPVFSDIRIGRHPARMVSLRISAGLPEILIIQVAETNRKRRAMMLDIIAADLIPQIIVTVIVLAWLRRGIEQGLRPLKRLAEEIDQRSIDDLTPLPETHIFKEIRTMADTVNNLLHRLAQAIATQQRFISNAAHQLRTPLAGLKLQAERAKSEADIQALQPALDQIQISTDRISRIIEQLLVLARSHSVSISQSLESAELTPVCQHVCMQRADKALKKNIELSFNAPPQTISVAANKTLLEELLGNLLDNAIAYSPAFGRIHVELERTPHPRLTVEDSGPGIPASEIGKVTERFYRTPGSPGNGCGLGLAIVQEIADLHRIKLVIDRSESLGGAKFSLYFQALT